MPSTEAVLARLSRSLGAGMVNIELTEDHLQDAIDQALDTYNQYLSRILYYKLPASSTQTSYDLTSIVDETSLTDVINVQFVPPGQIANIYNGMYEGTGLPFVNFTDQGLSFYQYREQLQNIEILFDSVPDFVYERISKRLFLKVPVGATYVVLVYSKLFTIEDIPQEHNQLFFRGALAYAKEPLGLIRRKYKGAELPGGTVELDGGELVTESKEAIEKYIEELKGQQKDTIMIA